MNTPESWNARIESYLAYRRNAGFNVVGDSSRLQQFGRFADQQMNMIWHHYVSHHHEAIALARLLEDPQKQIAPTGSTQPRLPVITTAGEKMQMLVAVVSLQACRHISTLRAGFLLGTNKDSGRIPTGSELGKPTLCKERKGWAPRHPGSPDSAAR